MNRYGRTPSTAGSGARASRTTVNRSSICRSIRSTRRRFLACSRRSGAAYRKPPTECEAEIETIIDFGKHDDELRPNPARWRGHLARKLPNPKLAGKHIKQGGELVKVERGHLAALDYKDAPEFAQRLRAEEGVLERALEFVLLTGARSGEVLGATWDETDFRTRTWTIPPARLKTGRKTRKPHVVPLSSRAMAILQELRTISTSEFVFPSRIGGQPLRANALRMLLRDLGYAGLTVHGFRSTFRDWCGDETNFPREVAEQALGHAVRGVEGDYRRMDALSKRRLLMDAWAAYCKSSPGSSAPNVLTFEIASGAHLIVFRTRLAIGKNKQRFGTR